MVEVANPKHEVDKYAPFERVVGNSSVSEAFVRCAVCNDAVLLAKRTIKRHRKRHSDYKARSSSASTITSMFNSASQSAAMIEAKSAKALAPIAEAAMAHHISPHQLHLFLNEPDVLESLARLSRPPKRTTVYSALDIACDTYASELASWLPIVSPLSYFSLSFDGTPPDHHDHAESLVLHFFGIEVLYELHIDESMTKGEQFAEWIVGVLIQLHSAKQVDVELLVSVCTDNDAAAALGRRLICDRLRERGFKMLFYNSTSCLGHGVDLLWEHFSHGMKLGNAGLHEVHNYYYGSGNLNSRRKEARRFGLPIGKYDVSQTRWGTRIRQAEAIVSSKSIHLEYLAVCKGKDLATTANLVAHLNNPIAMREIRCFASLMQMQGIIDRMQGAAGCSPDDVSALRDHFNSWAAVPALEQLDDGAFADVLADSECRKKLLKDLDSFAKYICVDSIRDDYKVILDVHQRYQFARAYYEASHAAYLEYLKVVENPLNANYLRNAMEPRSISTMLAKGYMRNFAFIHAADVMSELLKCGLNDHARLEDSQLRRLFVDIPNIPFGNEYKRFVQVASDTGGRMHMSSTNGTMSFWAESAQGPKMFPIVLTVARRLAVFCLNVCSNERVFSLTGYMDDSRKAALDSGRFAKRVLIVGNGTRISLKARVTEAEQDNATGESK